VGEGGRQVMPEAVVDKEGNTVQCLLDKIVYLRVEQPRGNGTILSAWSDTHPQSAFNCKAHFLGCLGFPCCYLVGLVLLCFAKDSPRAGIRFRMV
jgi:hypothetical protein